MKIIFVLLFCIISVVNAELSYVENTRNGIENFLHGTSNGIDKFISQEDYKVEQKTLTSGDLSFETINEQKKPSVNQINFKVRILLPRSRKSYKLTLDNYVRKGSMDEKSKSDDYTLGLAKGKKRIGIKFRGIEPDLFVSYQLNKTINLVDDWKFYIENKTTYFVDYDFENIFIIDFNKKIDEKRRLSFRNHYRFQEHGDDLHEVVHSLNLESHINNRSDIHYSLSSYSTKNDYKKYEVDYYYSGAKYKNFYHKNWAYYQVDLGLMYRDENSFDPTARFMFRVGVLFGNSKKVFKKIE